MFQDGCEHDWNQITQPGLGHGSEVQCAKCKRILTFSEALELENVLQNKKLHEQTQIFNVGVLTENQRQHQENLEYNTLNNQKNLSQNASQHKGLLKQNSEQYNKNIDQQTIGLFLNACLVLITFLALDNNMNFNKQQKEMDMRPIVMQTGYWVLDALIPIEKANGFVNEQSLITDWDKKILDFVVYKNVAVNVQGEITINKKKYKLCFFNKDGFVIDSVRNIKGYRSDYVANAIKGDSYFNAVLDKSSETSTIAENNLLLTYKDIEGNCYQTFSDFNTKVESKKIRCK